MLISIGQPDVRDAQRQREAFSHALRSNLFRGEYVREWVFGHARGAAHGLYIVLTNRRVLCLVGDAGAVRLEWAALHVTVTGATLRRVVMGSELVVRHRGGETRVHVKHPFRRQAAALAAGLTPPGSRTSRPQRGRR